MIVPGPWVIDNRSHYAEPAWGHQEPLQLGAVIAECPTAFGSHVVRAPKTIGTKCPTKADLDAMGMAHAHLVAAAPDLLSAAYLAFAELEANQNWTAHTASASAALGKAIDKAEGRS